MKDRRIGGAGDGQDPDLCRRVMQLEEAICGYERRSTFFELLIKSLPGLFYAFDDKFELHMWNKNVEQVTGYMAQEIPEHSLFELFDGEDLTLIRESIQDVFRTGQGVAEAVLITKEGRRIPYFFTGVSAVIEGTPYLLGMGLDISVLKGAEAALLESEALYRTFAARMTEGVTLIQQDRFVFVNNAFASMLGLTDLNDILGQDVMQFVSKEFEMYFRDLFDSILNGMSSERFFQARWVRPKKQEIWVEGRANLIQWKGSPTVLLTARDITETKLREISMQEEAAYLRRENVTLRSSIKDRYRFGDIIGKSSAIQGVYELILNSAATGANVIIYGESGTGKELVAKAIHQMSGRSAGPFVTVNCAAIPDTLIESEFFGYKKGAFTGAVSDKQGYLDQADGGTLFLDEVGELSLNLQAKLLRAIEGGGYSPVGGNATRHSDFRIIAATNKNLLEYTRKGLMREDFFYRIHIIPIEIPPLRQRKEDIPLLVEHFMRIYSPGKRLAQVSGHVLEALQHYDWPGNVRELQNVIQRYLTVKRIDFLSPAAPETHDVFGCARALPDKNRKDLKLHDYTENVEKAVITEALNQHRWNKSRTASALMISRKTLQRKMKRLGLV
ncbi:MAG TPA: sigma 54-interacting transcriptional regulator [Deltaproteobacteria bacterium]|nr:sigma 54-interacting transcriptional regulator [Deltaproteobacteria bacterium]